MANYITNPTTGSITPLDSVDAVYGLALQYGRLLVGGANIKTHYDVFDKDFLEYGAMIADYKVDAIASAPVNPLNNTFGSAKYPAIKKLYFGEWNDRSYEVEIKDSEAYAVVNGSVSFEVFVAQIINAINEGEKLEKDDNYKQLLVSLYSGAAYDETTDESNPASGGGVLSNLNQFEKIPTESTEYNSMETIPEKFSDLSYERAFTAVRDVVKGMTFNNGEYSGGYVSGADIDDIRIVVPYEFMNGASVQWLSRVFNMSETDTLAKIIETDVGYNAVARGGGDQGSTNRAFLTATIWILHTRAIGRVIRYQSEMEQFIRQRWSRWFGREVVDMYYFNQYEKAFAIEVQEINAKEE